MLHTSKPHDFGGIARNPNTYWAPALLLIPMEPPANLRMILNYNPVKRAIEDTPRPMLHIASELQGVAKSSIFARIDIKNEYWQLPLHKDSQR